jgi:hypothetical protein
MVGGVSFVDLAEYAHVTFWRERGIVGPDGYCDGLHVDSCDNDWLTFALEDFPDMAGATDPVSAQPYLLSLSPDGYHKDNISGGDPYGMLVQGDWLAPLENFSWTGPRRPLSASDRCDLLSYLRTTVLECAGFPALFGVESFEPIRKRLLGGIEVF